MRRTLAAVCAAVCIAWGLAAPFDALAQAQGLRLQRSLSPLPDEVKDQVPLHLSGDRVDAQGEEDVEIIGDARLRRGDLSLEAERIRLWGDTREVEAIGGVRLRAGSAEVSGPRLRMRVEDQIGVVNDPEFRIRRDRRPSRGASLASPASGTVDLRGSARTLHLEGEDRYRASEGRFTSCKPGNDDWYMTAREFDIDLASEIGEARGARLTFKGFSTPTLPYASFSLSDERKSGFLPPGFGVQGTLGAQLYLPFYWNIAPNRDATITPRITTQRGVQLLTEFRYLEPTYRGVAQYEYLPNDPIQQRSRYGVSLQHQYNRPGVATGLINYNAVSDNDYFRDLSGRLTIATQTYLPREGLLNYFLAPGWTATGRIQRFQTLQDVNLPVTPPYERVPQFTVVGLTPNLAGALDLGFNGEAVAFDHPTLPLGRRFTAYPSLALPLLRPGFFVTPKVGYHFTQYSVSRVGASPDPVVAGQAETSLTRGLPIASLDSGLVFERNVKWGGENAVNTLEPRLYYLYVPYRRQDQIPLFDTAVADFNYAQIFSENYYVGGDRISDANQVTLAVISRLIRSENGQEILRGLIGQRYYFKPQQVSLASTEPVRTDNSSSILLGLSGRITRTLTSESTVQIASATQSPERFNVAFRYQPEIGKILNLGYRYTVASLNPNPINPGLPRTDLRQVDVSAQWPIAGRWYGVGRLNYSLVDDRAVETLAGLEYNGGCWVIRTVAQRFVTGSGRTTNLFFLQLELDGFSRIGSNPLEALRRNIPGYSVWNAPGANASRFDFNAD